MFTTQSKWCIDERKRDERLRLFLVIEEQKYRIYRGERIHVVGGEEEIERCSNTGGGESGTGALRNESE